MTHAERIVQHVIERTLTENWYRLACHKSAVGAAGAIHNVATELRRTLVPTEEPRS